jgi:two-component sensor histidine kinase
MPDVTANGSRIARSAAHAPAGRYEGTFSVDDLADVRRLAADHGRHAGLGPRRVSDFVLAVNEVATNAIRHGCQRARLRLWTTPNGAHCEVHGGRWISGEHPSAIRLDDTDSLRLWLVWQICSDVALSHGPDGTTVRLSMDAN